nr:hypothetical protein B0A51_13031 [Rachicladosporium sp. CCFEE 5018]
MSASTAVPVNAPRNSPNPSSNRRPPPSSSGDAGHLTSDTQQAQDVVENPMQSFTNCSRSRGACHQALATAELVNLVFSYLEPRDLLNASNIDRYFASCIQRSARLRQKLFLEGDPEANYALLGKLVRLPFHINIRKPRTLRSNPPAPIAYTVTFLLNVERWQTFIPSDRVLSMLVCQSPIFAMSGTVVCPCSLVSPYPEAETVHIWSNNGHTVGDMVEVIRNLHAAHCACGFGEPGYVDRDGSAANIIRFEGQLVLRNDDPRVLEGFRPKLVLAS